VPFSWNKECEVGRYVEADVALFSTNPATMIALPVVAF
jgi:hypothetical protein